MINAPDMAGRNDISALPAIQWRRDMRLISIIMAIVLWLPPLFGVFNPACGRDSAPIALPTGTALPETAIAPATDVTPTEAAASIEDSSQTASPTSNPTKAPAAGGTATPTARPTATPSSRPTAASSGEDIELPEIEIPVKRSLRRRPPRRSRKAPAMASGSPLTMRAISSCRRFPCRKRRCVRYAHEKTAVCRLGRLDIAFAPGILKGRAEYG